MSRAQTEEHREEQDREELGDPDPRRRRLARDHLAHPGDERGEGGVRGAGRPRSGGRPGRSIRTVASAGEVGGPDARLRGVVEVRAIARRCPVPGRDCPPRPRNRPPGRCPRSSYPCQVTPESPESTDPTGPDRDILGRRRIRKSSGKSGIRPRAGRDAAGRRPRRTSGRPGGRRSARRGRRSRSDGRGGRGGSCAGRPGRSGGRWRRSGRPGWSTQAASAWRISSASGTSRGA